MARQRVLFALLVVALALLSAPTSYADSYARIVRLSDLEGSVQIDRNTGHGFEKAVQNMPITQGVRLETGANGRAEVEFENGSVLRLTENSSVEFSALSLRSDGNQVNEVRVPQGTVYVDFRRKGNTDFKLLVGNHPIDLTKDVRLRLRADRCEAEIAVFKGELKVEDAGESAKVKKNQTLRIDLAGAERNEVAKGITEYPSDEWNQERRQYLDQYASNHGNSPYAYGYSDLNRYGSFFNAPGYGLVWRPSGVGVGFDPYADGYWSYYPGQGYVWISGYQWGWTPYRYGNWTYLNGYGWCWRPGNWNHWNTGVAVNNPPPAWRNPTPPPPNAGGGTTVIVGRPVTPRGPRKIDVNDMDSAGPAQGRSTVNGVAPGTTGPAGVVRSRPVTPGVAGGAAASSSGTQAAQPAARPERAEPNRPTKMMRNDPGFEPPARHERQAPAPSSAPARQASPPQPHSGSQPKMERSAPPPAPAPRMAPPAAPAPTMKSSPPPSAPRQSRTSPK
jgi:hypothetical protein